MLRTTKIFLASIPLLIVIAASAAVAQVDRSHLPTLSLVDSTLSLSRWYHHVPDEYRDYRGLVIEEVEAIEHHPIVPIIYFDSASGVIPSRYALLDSYEQTLTWREEKIEGGAMVMHHNVLNVLGARLRAMPGFRIALQGCNSSLDTTVDTGETIAVSAARAKSVYDYLTTVWRIPAQQIKVLPAQWSPAVMEWWRDPRSNALNRRVEIYYMDSLGRRPPLRRSSLPDHVWNVLKPLTYSSVVHRIVSSSATFRFVDTTPNSLIYYREVEIRRNDRYLGRVRTYSVLDDHVTVDWRGWDRRDPFDSSDRITAQLVVSKLDGGEVRSNEVSIPVLHQSRQQVRTTFATDRRLVIVSIVDVPMETYRRPHRFEPQESPVAKRIILPTVGSASRVDIVGHRADDSSRAEWHARMLGGVIRTQLGKSSIDLIAVGAGQDEPMFDNTLPEGRALDQGVHVTIETVLRTKNR